MIEIFSRQKAPERHSIRFASRAEKFLYLPRSVRKNSLGHAHFASINANDSALLPPPGYSIPFFPTILGFESTLAQIFSCVNQCRSLSTLSRMDSILRNCFAMHRK